MSGNFNYNSSFAIYKRVLKEAFVPNIWYFLFAIALMILGAASVAYRAYLIKPAIDEVFLNKNTMQLVTVPIKLIIVAIAIGLSTYLEGYIMHMTTTKINIDYQRKLFCKLINFDICYFQDKSSNTILSQFDDINGLMSALSLLLNGLIRQFFTILALVGLMFKQSFYLSIIAFIGFPIIIYPIYAIGRKLKYLANRGLELSTDLKSSMGESLSLIQLVKSSNTEDYEMDKFDKIVKENYILSMKMVCKSLITSPIMEMAGSIGFAGVIWFGGMAVINGTMTSGAFFAFITALLSAYKPAKSFAGTNIQIQTAVICAKRLFTVLDAENVIKNKPDATELQNVKGNIEFDNVAFRYPSCDTEKPSDKLALNNLNLNIEQGTSVALVGHSGSGKSTIFKLLLRFYDPTEGDIKIDNNCIRDITMESLRSNISIVSQDVLIFNANVWENVRYGNLAITNEQIKRACEMAHANEFIDQLKSGYDTILGPGGSMLSGGQRQRISIARAILKNAPILLLDEATSALDPISEKSIQKALHTLMKGKTTIIIAHRLTTVQNCDKIFVMQGGSIIESGNHEELLELNGRYKELYQTQFIKLDDFTVD